MPQDAGIKKLVGYVRVSSVAGRDQNQEAFQSPGVQREAMERWAATKFGRNGYKWLKWFTDLDSSGSSIQRPLLEQASTLAIVNSADLVVYNFSRYSRNLPEGLAALKALEVKGVRVRSATEGIEGTSAEDELTLQLFMMLNQYQLAKTGESWRGIARRNKEAGRWHGVVPFGYRRATEAEKKKLGRSVGVIVPDEKNAKSVRRIFDLYATGQSLYHIGQLGVKNDWFKRIGTAKEILQNPVYLGLLPVKEYVPAMNKRTNQRRHDTHQRPLKEVKRDTPVGTVPGLHKAIISQPLWDRVQLRLSKEKRAPRTKYTQPRYFAGGRVRCASCRKKLVFLDKKEFGQYLTCKNQSCTGRPGSVKVREFEAMITAYMHQLPITVKPKMDKATKGRHLELAAAKARRAKIEQDLNRYATQRGDLALSLATGEFRAGLTVDDAQAALVRLRERIARLEQEQLAMADLEVMEPQFEMVRGFVLQVGKLWDLASAVKRVEILEALGIEILISEATEYNQSLEGRVTLRTSLPLEELNAGLSEVSSPEKAKSGPPKKSRLRG